VTDLDAPIFNIEGELVALGPLRREHTPLYLRWINDFSTTRTLGVPPRPMTLEQETAWYEQAAVDGARIGFTIYERATGRAIGNCGLHEVDLANRRTVVGIMIGEPEARGRGYGTEAMRLLLDYAFTVLGLHSVMLTSSSTTAPAAGATRRSVSARWGAGGRAAGTTAASGTRSTWTSWPLSSLALFSRPSSP
jgi:RimJ/RimL family protein N-acetyltransferase